MESRPRPRITFKAKDLDPKAKAKDFSHKAKAKDLDFGHKDQGQGQGLTSLATVGRGKAWSLETDAVL